jgi:hypothetical protein
MQKKSFKTRLSETMPKSRITRLFLGVALIAGGALGFLPVLGFWMIPLGLFVLSVDSAYARRFRRKLEIVFGRLAKRFQKAKEEK